MSRLSILAALAVSLLAAVLVPIGHALAQGDADAAKFVITIPDRPPPGPVPDTYPVRCSADYLLVPGERAVLTCIAHDHRVPVEGSVTLQSGHEAVDVTLVRRLALGRVVLAVTNRGAEPVEGVATVEIY